MAVCDQGDQRRDQAAASAAQRHVPVMADRVVDLRHFKCSG